MQARWGTHGDHPIIVLSPGSVQDCFDLTVKAFNLSERFRTPVILLSDAIISSLQEKVEIPDADELTIVDRAQPTVSPEEYKPYEYSKGEVAPLPAFGKGYRFHATGLLHDERGFPTEDSKLVSAWWDHMHSKIDDHLDEILLWEETQLDDAEITLIAYGGTSLAAAHAVTLAREQGINLGLLKLQTIWPFPDAMIKRLAGRVKRIIVPELNFGQVRLEVERAVAGLTPVEGIHRADGRQISPQQIVERVLDQEYAA